MIYGVLGDIHGNLDALDSVLEFFDASGVERILCVGDVVGYGAQPNECVARLREREAVCVVGNHDYAAIEQLDITYFNDTAKEAILWTRAVLQSETKRFLADLPLTFREGSIVVVHSSLADPAAFDYILSWEEAQLSLTHLKSGEICFFGHSHVPLTFVEAANLLLTSDDTLHTANFDKVLVNVGSVGQPRDQIPDACCVLFDSEKRELRRVRIPYDIESAGRKILDAGLPAILAKRLTLGK